MDKRKAFLNVIVSVGFKIVLLVVSFINRRMVISFLGNEVNGVSSLYSSIIGILSVAELGIGSAITFSMYKPIVENDTNKIAALYGLYKKFYMIIGSVIFVAGTVIMPFLRYLIKDVDVTNVNLYSTFFIFLLSTVVTYFYGAKSSLINAYKDNYIVATIESGCTLLKYILQITLLFKFRSFEVYLVCGLISSIVEWLVLECIVKKKYKLEKCKEYSIDQETKKTIVQNTKALFISNIGSMLVNTIDSVVISAFVGVVILGKYSNYTVIMSAMMGIISLIFTSLRSVIGHFYASESIEVVERYFDYFHVLNFIIGLLFFLGYYAIIDDLIQLCFGEGLLLNREISFVITLNYFIQYFRNALSLFRTASGVFYPDRWRPLFEGLSNLVLSILFVKILPGDLSIVGVIIATILTNMLIYNTTAPYIFYKYVLHKSSLKHYFQHLLLIVLFICSMLLLNIVKVTGENLLVDLLINGTISVGISILVALIILLFNKSFREYLISLYKKYKRV